MAQEIAGRTLGVSLLIEGSTGYLLACDQCAPLMTNMSREALEAAPFLG